jgi:DNA-binding response OmpR family regulator
MPAKETFSQRVLVTEDDPENLLLLQTWLGQAGYLVLPAAKGQTAVEWLRQAGKPDLAVLDRTLPDMDGLELCRAIKRDPETSKIPVMILTASTDNAGRIDAKLGNADLYLNKPVTEEDFLNGVRSLIEKSGGYLQRRGLLHREGFEIDPERHTVFYGGKTTEDIGGKLFDLMYLLAEHHPHVLSRKFILQRLGAKSRNREVDVLVSLLRTELRRLFRYDMIETVAGQGYRLQLPALLSKGS